MPHAVLHVATAGSGEGTIGGAEFGSSSEKAFQVPARLPARPPACARSTLMLLFDPSPAWPPDRLLPAMLWLPSCPAGCRCSTRWAPSCLPLTFRSSLWRFRQVPAAHQAQQGPWRSTHWGPHSPFVGALCLCLWAGQAACMHLLCAICNCPVLPCAPLCCPVLPCPPVAGHHSNRPQARAGAQHAAGHQHFRWADWVEWLGEQGNGSRGSSLAS